MKYNGTVYRPPIEANTFLLPVTEGCTHNSCTFCNMYQDIPFRMLSVSEVEEYLRQVKQSYTMSAFVGTKLDEDIKTGTFIPATEKENLEEEYEFLRLLDLPDCYFWAVHPLDSVKLEGMLRECKQQMLGKLSRSIANVNENAINRTSRVGTL